MHSSSLLHPQTFSFVPNHCHVVTNTLTHSLSCRLSPDLIYHAPESSTSTEPSPVVERKSFPRKLDVSKVSRAGGAFTSRGLGKVAASLRGGASSSSATQETSLSFPKKMSHGSSVDSKSSEDSKYGFTRKISPPVAFSGSHNELSEAECDLETRKRAATEGDAPPYIGHSRSQFRSYVSGRSSANKDYSIKV